MGALGVPWSWGYALGSPAVGCWGCSSAWEPEMSDSPAAVGRLRAPGLAVATCMAGARILMRHKTYKFPTNFAV